MKTLLPVPPHGFKHVPGFRGYAVSRGGVLISCCKAWKKRPLYATTWHRVHPVVNTWKDPTRNRVVYPTVRIRWADGKKRQVRLHTLVLLTYRGPRPIGAEACHRSGNTLNNRISNLRWGTRGSNQRDRYRHGHGVVGEQQWSARLTEKDVRYIRACRRPPMDLAKKYRVHYNTIYAILNRDTWMHVPGPTRRRRPQ